MVSLGPLGLGQPALAAEAAAAGVGVAGRDTAGETATAPVPTVPPAPEPQEPVVTRAPDRARPAPSVVATAVAAARRSGARVTVGELMSDRSMTTAAPDGTLTTELSARPVRFRDGAGAWRELDLTLGEATGGRLRPRAAAPGAPSVLDRSGPGGLVTVGSGATEFSWGPVDALSVLPAVGRAVGVGSPSSVRFPRALSGGRDVLLQLGASSVSESVVLPDRAAALLTPGYTDLFTVPAGVTARQGAAGVEFVDAAGNPAGSFGGGHAFDSSSSPELGEPVTAPVATRLVSQTGRRVLVSVGVDLGWLLAPERAFPVTIDPEFTAVAAPNRDTYIDSGFPDDRRGLLRPVHDQDRTAGGGDG